MLFGLNGGGHASASQRSPYAKFPLYKDVSGHGPFATLDEGQLPNKTRWGAYASRVGKGRLGYERPCLSLAHITRWGQYTDVHGCGIPAPTEKRSMPVFLSIAATYQTKPDGPFIGEAILGLTFSTAVRSVVLEYEDGGQLQRQTRLFNSKQQKKTKLPPFRYIAVALQKDVCVSNVIGFSKNGTELFSFETLLC
jgi:hypothetical protein